MNTILRTNAQMNRITGPPDIARIIKVAFDQVQTRAKMLKLVRKS